MQNQELIEALSETLPKQLAFDIVDNFVSLRRELIMKVYDGGSSGKFVESTVQILQFLDQGTFEETPRVEYFLSRVESQSVQLHVDLRICVGRVCRSMYTLRSKRNIAHKGEVDSNSYDLQYLFCAAQWVLSEFVRHSMSQSKSVAGKLVAQIHAPISTVIDVSHGRRIVVPDMTVSEELLSLLYSYHPEMISIGQIDESTKRRSPSTVQNALRSLWRKKYVERTESQTYFLTSKGLDEATMVVSKFLL